MKMSVFILTITMFFVLGFLAGIVFEAERSTIVMEQNASMHYWNGVKDATRGLTTNAPRQTSNLK